MGFELDMGFIRSASKRSMRKTNPSLLPPNILERMDPKIGQREELVGPVPSLRKRALEGRRSQSMNGRKSPVSGNRAARR